MYAVSGADPENDDLDLVSRLRMRPREVDDEAEDAEIEAAEDAQQKLFDAEAIETTKPAKKGVVVIGSERIGRSEGPICVF